MSNIERVQKHSYEGAYEGPIDNILVPGTKQKK